MLLAALRRFLKLLAGAAGATAVASVALGLLFGASLSRAVSIGFYLSGCLLVSAGFFLGNRGPVRSRDDRPMLLFGSRYLRWATPEERDEAISSSAVFVTLGFALILIGAAADTRHRLF